MKIGIFIFCRDLRFTDNHALNLLANEVDKIVPVFIYDKKQIFKNKKNIHYFSQRAADFIVESVKSLPINAIYKEDFKKFMVQHKATHIGFNEDFSPFAKQRTKELKNAFPDIIFITAKTDLFLCNYTQYYKVFGVFYKNRPKTIAPYTNRKIKNILSKTFKQVHIAFDKQSPSLAARMNMGLVSIREQYKIKRDKNLFWRDFHLIMYNNENANKYIDKRFNKINKRFSRAEFKKLWDCRTGFPMVDASMNQLKTTGYCPNRSRLVLGYFWCKYLRIPMFNKKYGSYYCFSRLLIDAIGCSQNLMNHHWLIDTDYGGRRFGKGISGRPFSLKVRKEDREYVKKWCPGNYPPMFDEKLRYKSWVKLTLLL